MHPNDQFAVYRISDPLVMIKYGNAIVIALLITNTLSCSDDDSDTNVELPAWSVFNTSNSPLPDNQIQVVLVDGSDGKWFGTSNGLAHLSGSGWKVYDTLNSGLPSQFITSMAWDKRGFVWIGTSRGLAKYDGITLSFCEKLKQNFITALLVDNKTGMVWIGTDKGLCNYDGSVWMRYDDPGSLLLEDYVSSLAVDHNGVLKMGSFDHYAFVGRILSYDGSNWTSIRLNQRELESCFPDALIMDENNTMWLGVKGTMGGKLVRLDQPEWKIFDQNNIPIPDWRAGINSLARYQNTLWIATGSGMYTYDGTSWTSYRTTNSGLSDDFVFSIAIDNEGSQWIGTINGVTVRRLHSR